MSEDVNIEVLDGGLGLIPSGADEVHAVVGTCSTGDDLSIVATRSIDNLIAARGHGPGIEAAAFAIKQTGKTVLFLKAPTDTAGAASAVNNSLDLTSTSVVTVTGTPNDAYDVILEITTGGTRGTPGIFFRYSLDGGETYSAKLPLGSAVTYLVPNTGMTIAFAAGTLDTGAVFTWTTTPPLWAAGDVADGIVALGNGVSKFRLIHLVGDLDAADATSLDTEVEALTTSYRYVGMLGHARDFETADTDENGWIDALTDDFAGFASTRVSVTAGHYRVTSPISGRRYRRPLSFVAAARLMGRPLQEHAGRVRTGALKGIQASENDTVSHDSRITPGLKTARFMTARTRIGRPGWFIDQPQMMSSPSSDYQRWPHRSVIDKACDLTYEVLVDVLNDDLQVDPVTGFIVEKEAKAIESRLRSAFRDGILAKRYASAVSATIKRDDNIITTKTLTASIRVTPKGYVEGIDASVGFTNPALELA